MDYRPTELLINTYTKVQPAESRANRRSLDGLEVSNEGDSLQLALNKSSCAFRLLDTLQIFIAAGLRLRCVYFQALPFSLLQHVLNDLQLVLRLNKSESLPGGHIDPEEDRVLSFLLVLDLQIFCERDQAAREVGSQQSRTGIRLYDLAINDSLVV